MLLSHAAQKRGAVALSLCLALGAALQPARRAQAQDHSAMYAEAALSADAQRLEARVRTLYGLLTRFLTAKEKKALERVKLSFPPPEKGDYVLEFYTYQDGSRPVVAMPILSLKAVEDLTLAHAYLRYHKGPFGAVADPVAAIDIYFAMMRRKDPAEFANGRYPPILQALGIPLDAYKEKRVGDLATSLRNEAWFFMLAHELGHVIKGHGGGYAEIPAEQARREEADADAFAHELMARSSTPGVGAYFLFAAQAYSLAHRGQFKSEQEWIDFMRKRSFHPLTTERMRALAGFHEGPLAKKRPSERRTWREIAALQRSVADVLDDRQQQDCIAAIGETGDIAALKSGAGSTALLLKAWGDCKR